MRDGLRILIGLAALLGAAAARAQLLDTALTLGKKPDAVVLPLTIATAGTYRITVTDLGSASGPPRLARVDAGVAFGSALVTSASVTTANATGVASKTFGATAGSHRLILIGQPNAPSTVGSAGVKIDDPASGAVLLDTVQAFTVPPPPTASPATFEHDIAINTAGTYTLAVTDFALPLSLAKLHVTVVRKSDPSTFLVDSDVSGSAELAVVSGAPDTYQVFVYAELATNAARGLVGLSLRDAGGADVFPPSGETGLHELGDWPYKYPLDAGAPATLTLTLGDLGFPLPLASVGAVLAERDGRRATATLVAPGSTTTVAPVGGALIVYASATAAAGSGTNAGSFGLTVADGAGTRLADTVQSVTSPQPVTDVGAIDRSFDVSATGTYTLTLTDFGASGFFDAFTSFDLALSRDNQIVQSLSAPGSFDFAATPGHYSLAILADPAGANGQGLLGVSVVGPGGATVYEDTAAVGTGFVSAKFVVSTAESVDVTLTDLGFPADFNALKVAVTRGATRAGEIVGDGRFSFAATPGQYFVNLLATPDAALGYSTLGVHVDATPAGPVVVLGASATSVQAGGSVMLTWTSTDATSCAASGGWSGSRATSGSATVGPLNSDTTFTLTCSGAGGSDDESVAITITPEQRSGGGGAFDWLTLGALGLLAAAARGARPRA
jgi:hypothetical protein